VQELWDELRGAVQLVIHHDPTLWGVISFSLKVTLIATVSATVVGVPLGAVLGLGRFPGRRTLRLLANASLGLPPVVVGLVLFLCFVPQGPLGFLYWNATRKGVYAAQALLALPYVVALTAAALEALPEGLLSQARLLGAGRMATAALALREARVGVIAAVLAALGTTLSEVAAIAIVGGNIYGFDQTLASAALYEANQARYTEAIGSGLVLAVMILIVMGATGILQQYGGGIRWRLRPAR
jgi:tungstate transport system permease protein